MRPWSYPTERSTLIRGVSRGAGAARPSISGNRMLHGVEKRLVVERFRKEVHRPRLHSAYGHGNVAMAGDEDDRDVIAGSLEDLLQLEAALTRHSDIEQETARAVIVAPVEELSHRGERLHAIAGRPEEPLDAAPNRRIVVDDDHGRLIVDHAVTVPLRARLVMVRVSRRSEDDLQSSCDQLLEGN